MSAIDSMFGHDPTLGWKNEAERIAKELEAVRAEHAETKRVLRELVAQLHEQRSYDRDDGGLFYEYSIREDDAAFLAAEKAVAE